jgi:hypothetical protein
MRRSLRPIVLVAFAVICGATAAGCGGGGASTASATGSESTAPVTTSASPVTSARASSSKPAGVHKLAYERAMKQLSGNLSDILRTIGSDDLTILQDDTSTTPQAITRMVGNLERGKKALRAASVKLGSIAPPPAVAADHRRLGQGLRDLATELDPIIEQVRRGQGQIAITAIAGQKGISEMQQASQDIARRGYAIA